MPRSFPIGLNMPSCFLPVADVFLVGRMSTARFFFPRIPFIIFALHVLLPLSRNSDPGLHTCSRLFPPPLRYTVRALRFVSREDLSAFFLRRLTSNCAYPRYCNWRSLQLVSFVMYGYIMSGWSQPDVTPSHCKMSRFANQCIISRFVTSIYISRLADMSRFVTEGWHEWRKRRDLSMQYVTTLHVVSLKMSGFAPARCYASRKCHQLFVTAKMDNIRSIFFMCASKTTCPFCALLETATY